jgi:hypothetical protein
VVVFLIWSVGLCMKTTCESKLSYYCCGESIRGKLKQTLDRFKGSLKNAG